MHRRHLRSPAGATLVFDCDGVLVDSEILSERAYRDGVAEVGIDLPDALWAECVGRKRADIFALIEAAAGKPVPEATRARIPEIVRGLFEKELRATAGVREFLSGSSAPRCVASSSDPDRIGLSLRLTGLDGYFPAGSVFSSQEVRHGKPAPDLYLHAARRMGFDPPNCVVIEDSAPGVVGAKAAGMFVVGYVGATHVRPGHDARLAAAGADLVASDWTAIAAALREDATSRIR
ncbi:MAG: HAD family phosphatase [Hyphomicrobiales bacterium]|nr:HAD family phosphatase [Hyphomicrobiales bacterium]